MRQTRSIVQLVSLLGIAACGGGGGNPTPISFADFKTQAADVYCTFALKCCKPAEQVTTTWGATTQADCKTKFADNTFKSPCATEVDASKITFDATLAQACLDSLKAATCAGGTSTALAKCQTAILTSKAAVGEACTACQSSTYCASASNYCDLAGTNKCTAYAAKDGSCTSAPCDPAGKQYCDTTGTMKCTSYLAIGGDCGTSGVCDGSTSYCDSAGTKQCTALKADGADCGGGGECKNYNCVAGKCAAAANTNFCTGM